MALNLFAVYVIIGLSVREGYKSPPVSEHVKMEDIPRNIRLALEKLSQERERQA